jgi:hypothetical protein
MGYTAGNPRKLSINTAFLNQFTGHESPMTSIPSSPSYYSPSSPSEIHTPYSEDYYPQSAVDGNESYGYNQGYNPYAMELSEANTCASSPASMSSYYQDDYIQQPQQLYAETGLPLPVDYSAYGSYSL